MSYTLFLDDLRDTSYVGLLPLSSPKIARTYEEAVYIVKNYGLPSFVYFDHDLGEEKTGYDFAKWLVVYMMDKGLGYPDNFNYYVHSANPVGKEAIIQYFKSYKKHDENLNR